MKLDKTTITLIVSLGLNVFQGVSQEAREWYAIKQSLEPSKAPIEQIIEKEGMQAK